jgi:hypothetical protein
MANVFRVEDSEILARHRANIKASLAHRLEVARANRNEHLVALLEREQRQIGVEPGYANGALSLVQWLRQKWNELMQAIAKSSQLSVERVSANGTIFWYAYDPETGKALYAESETEVLDWIEKNNLGR